MPEDTPDKVLNETATHESAAPETFPRDHQASLLQQIEALRQSCTYRYNFNNRWDIFMNVMGIGLSIMVVIAGFVRVVEVSAVLGALVGAVVTAQRAFPFGQRASFYRLLIGQTQNLGMRAEAGVLSKVEVINTLASLRMDFAQQLPRGSTSQVPATSPERTEETAP